MGLSQRVPSEATDADIASQLLSMVRIARKSAPGEDIIFEIKPAKRSADQNALAHVWIRHIGQQLGCDDETVAKQWLLTECYGEHYRELNGRKMQVYPRTSKFSKKQMQQWLDWLDNYAGANGIHLPAAPGMEGLM